jgi:GT2 family glycosyltransferase
MTPALCVIILNYRTPALTLDCLRSLAACRDEIPAGGLHAILIDNGSADDSPAQLSSAIEQNAWSDWITFLPLAENLGFAGGNNVALDLAKSRFPDTPYVLLLNSDTIVHPGTLRYCYDLMQRTPTIGVMSCRLEGADGAIQNTTRAFPTPLKQAICSFGLPWTWRRAFAWADIYDVPDALLRTARNADWLCGAFLFTRAAALQKIGGHLDDSFFFYGEDIEFCHRMHRAGFTVYYDPAAAITHIGGSSSDPTRVDSKLIDAYTWHARYQIQRICYGHLASAFIRTCDILALTLKKTRLLLTGHRQTPRYQSTSTALSILLKPIRLTRKSASTTPAIPAHQATLSGTGKP